MMSAGKTVPLRINPGESGSTLGEKPEGQQSFRCEVVRSRRKTLAIHVKHRRVEVRVPLRASKKEVEYFVSENREWIETRLRDELVRFDESLQLVHGRKIFYRAREFQIEFREHRKKRVLIEGKRFVIQGYHLTTARAKQQLAEHLQEKAMAYMPQRTQALADLLGVGDKLKKVRFRKTKTKWGHCTSAGTIQFNPLIMLAPYAIIDYIIIHEVCHLLHMDHSRRYWNRVAKLCPEYKTYIKWLKEHEHRFWF